MLCVRDGVHHKPKIVDTWLFILVMWICACLNGFMNYCLNNCMNNCMNYCIYDGACTIVNIAC